MVDKAPTPPEQEVDLSDVKLTEFRNKRRELYGQLLKVIAEYFTVERDLFIYRLVKTKDIGVYTVAEAASLSPKMIYEILEKVENGLYE